MFTRSRLLPLTKEILNTRNFSMYKNDASIIFLNYLEIPNNNNTIKTELDKLSKLISDNQNTNKISLDDINKLFDNKPNVESLTNLEKEYSFINYKMDNLVIQIITQK